MATQGGDVRYINASLGAASTPFAPLPAQIVTAEAYISRSGAVVDKCNDYYVSVFRLAFSTDNSVPLWIPRMVAPSIDGLSLENTITLRATVGGIVYRGRASMKLQIQPSQIVLHANQPQDSYAFVWNTALFVSIFNDCLLRSYAALIAAGAPLNPLEEPSISYNGTGLFTWNAYPYSLWAEPWAVGADRVEIFLNQESSSMMNGWLLLLVTPPGQPDLVNGEDVRVRLVGNGANYSPPPAGAQTSPFPTNPATSSIQMLQSNRTVFPGISTIRLVSTLPCAAEFVPGLGGADASAILTDFRPDPSDLGSEVSIYNASFGDARWIRLTGPQPLTQFTLRLETVDWQGRVRPLVLAGLGQEASVKLCFAPLRMIDHS